MDLLPDDVEREHLIGELANLIATAGAERFLNAPILEPNDRSFPDPWTADAAGVTRLIQRLLGYAGLDHLRLTLEIDQFSQATGKVLMDGTAGGHEGTAAWFAGIRDGVCAFGLDTRGLEDPIGLIGVLAHEVAHAYRHEKALRQPVTAHEERLTDLTTVYLGSGILTTNATQRFRSGQKGAGSWYSRAQAGYLPMQSMSYLLAAQVVARGTPPSPIAKGLSPNQRACFKAACASLERPALCEQLGLPIPAPAAERGWFGRLFKRS
ncbi:MAG: hypothetical protein QM831_03150 [Kofleriaceae bacterium]